MTRGPASRCWQSPSATDTDGMAPLSSSLYRLSFVCMVARAVWVRWIMAGGESVRPFRRLSGFWPKVAGIDNFSLRPSLRYRCQIVSRGDAFCFLLVTEPRQRPRRSSQLPFLPRFHLFSAATPGRDAPRPGIAVTPADVFQNECCLALRPVKTKARAPGQLGQQPPGDHSAQALDPRRPSRPRAGRQ